MASAVPGVPAGWPAEVPPPGSEDFTARAVDWLLDIVPPGYREHDIFRRWPAALASLAHYHAKAVLEGHRQGYRVVRTELSAAVPPHAMDSVMEVYRTEGQRHADIARAVDLVARALYDAA